MKRKLKYRLGEFFYLLSHKDPRKNMRFEYDFYEYMICDMLSSYLQKGCRDWVDFHFSSLEMEKYPEIKNVASISYEYYTKEQIAVILCPWGEELISERRMIFMDAERENRPYFITCDVEIMKTLYLYLRRKKRILRKSMFSHII